VIRLDSPSISIHYQINKAPFDALYNPVVGVNIMSASFAHDLLIHMPLNPTTKLLTGLSGHIFSMFRDIACPPYLGKRNHGSFELLYL
jgi:hypothetical protein